ncbi:hypothetical protein TWF703_003936 [Orbilia oligospora]|uniref:Uncharacterized protein n=1 Tax=Orbilia oligospora TaxID=2813651 RepID=A0A7C8K576_ORBOL|nr:hypothetical protein TWF703_003936 [Orbilia oligospora]
MKLKCRPYLPGLVWFHTIVKAYALLEVFKVSYSHKPGLEAIRFRTRLLREMSGPSAAPFDAARAEKLHQDLGSEIRKLGNMPALQGFDDLQRRLEETINGAVERAVTAAVERAVTAAVERAVTAAVERAVTAAVDRAVTAAVDRAVEQAFENFRRDNDARYKSHIPETEIQGF